MNIKGQGHSMTLDQGHSDSNIFKLLFLETARLIEARFHVEFHVEPSSDGRMKVSTNGLCPRWPPCPYMVKTFKNLLWNQKADDLETWYVALVT